MGSLLHICNEIKKLGAICENSSFWTHQNPQQWGSTTTCNDSHCQIMGLHWLRKFLGNRFRKLIVEAKTKLFIGYIYLP